MSAQRGRKDTPSESIFQHLLGAIGGCSLLVSVRAQIEVPVSGVENESDSVAKRCLPLRVLLRSRLVQVS